MQLIPNIWGEPLFPNLFQSTVLGVYLMVMYLWARQVQIRKESETPAYQLYTLGLFAKVLGALALCLIYTLYYDGGDTTGYFISSKALVNLLLQNPADYLRVIIMRPSAETYSLFSQYTGYPMYIHDANSFIVVKYTSFFTLLGFKDYITTSILFAWFFYTGYWKFYLLLVRLYPKYYKAFAISVIFFPSVLFWGSGILKDTIALSMTGWFLYAFYHAFVIRKRVFANILAVMFTGFIVVSIKAYIFVALLPGVMIWLGWSYIRRFQNPVVRFILTPIVTLLFLGLGIGALGVFGGFVGEYGTIDGILQKAIITYEDHTRAAEYGYNFYDLGTFDGTLGNFLSKAPAAITAGLFRPFVWEVRNPVMLLASLENMAFFIMLMVILWRTGPAKTVKIAFDEPLVIFALSFALVFAFAVGVATANFGALVRLKIPLIPFLAAGLFILFYRSQELKNEN